MKKLIKIISLILMLSCGDNITQIIETNIESDMISLEWILLKKRITDNFRLDTETNCDLVIIDGWDCIDDGEDVELSLNTSQYIENCNGYEDWECDCDDNNCQLWSDDSVYEYHLISPYPYYNEESEEFLYPLYIPKSPLLINENCNYNDVENIYYHPLCHSPIDVNIEINEVEIELNRIGWITNSNVEFIHYYPKDLYLSHPSIGSEWIEDVGIFSIINTNLNHFGFEVVDYQIKE